MKILISCANGAATSLMMRNKIEQALKDLQIVADDIHHCSITKGKEIAKQYDVVFCSVSFVALFQEAAENGVKIIGLQNILSVAEAKASLRAAGFAS